MLNDPLTAVLPEGAPVEPGSGKLDVLRALLRRCSENAPDERTVIASQYTRMLDSIEAPPLIMRTL